ncbi:MAG: hypothetical protein NTZ27_05700 [Ignavibacteriales bacterium]|nr:hypothetical protein [Ignavibacteriales bacterium]
METLDQYIKETESAVKRIYDAYYSYYELMKEPKRPFFFYCGDTNTEEFRNARDKWEEENKDILEERIRRDNEFAFATFARSTLCGAILQFGYTAIKLFSNNTLVPEDFENIIVKNSIAAKFCIGRMIDDMPAGLIVFAGRNQAMHFEDEKFKEPTATVFNRLCNYYSDRFKKWYKNSYYDLENIYNDHFAENILYKLEWMNYDLYEKEIRTMLSAI